MTAPDYAIVHDDCFNALKELPDHTFDSVVTDPPYGLGFMGKHWDHGVPAADVWAEILRVLKPGGHLLAFAGTRTQHRMACNIEDAGFEVRDLLAWTYAQGFPKSMNLKDEWKGWGTALKPAFEPITMARKPLIGTVAANVAEHRTGALNIDGCRIPTTEDERAWQARNSGGTTTFKVPGATAALGAGIGRPVGEFFRPSESGRWPANFLHDGSPEVDVVFPRTKGCRVEKPSACATEGATDFTGMRGNRPARGYADDGSAARFFFCAKASGTDREEGAPPSVAGKHNVHPTVKPTDRMRWLCRLVTPPGGLVLDPFTGSGSTGKAALLEGFRFMGIEREADYVAIAEARCAHAAAQMVSKAA